MTDITDTRKKTSSKSLSAMALKRFCQNRSAVISFFVLSFIFICCVATLGISSKEFSSQNLELIRTPPNLIPSEGHPFSPFGYDMLGRSLLWRCMFGGVLSLGIGLASAAISVIIGTTWGMVSGWYGGKVDNIMMRIVDILYGLPYILLVILFKIAFEKPLADNLGWLADKVNLRADLLANFIILFAAIGGISWLNMARVIRGQVLSLKSRPFIEACRAIGLPTSKIFTRHLIPNLAGPIIVYATLTVPQAILQESFLSFIGIGIQAPMPTWGSLAGESVKAINTVESFWWMVVFPSGFLGITLLCLNFIGDGMRDALDPRGKR